MQFKVESFLFKPAHVTHWS